MAIMRDDTLRCPKCHARVVQRSDDKLKIRTRMLALSLAGTEVVCRKCGADVPLDVELGAELRKALGADARRLVIRNTKTVDRADRTP